MIEKDLVSVMRKVKREKMFVFGAAYVREDSAHRGDWRAERIRSEDGR